jgi:UDP-N-acetylglucosamine transferase subunit ALG13
MIFVTVGMHSQGFDRLIKKMDEIAGKIDEEVVMQIGSAKYKPKNAKYFDFKDSQKIQELSHRARLVVCHGGAGTIIVALEQGVPVIAVPRLKRYYEVIDDHQLELVNALAKDGKIMVVYDIDKLERVLNSPFVNSPMKIKKDNRMVRALREYINELAQ